MKLTKTQLAQIIREEVRKSRSVKESKGKLKEAKEIKLPTNFFLANFGKGGKYAICFARGGDSLSAKEIAKYGKMCEQLVDKYMDEFQIHSTSDDSYTFIYKNALIVCYYFYSEIKDPTDVVAKVDKAVHMF